MRPFGSWLRWGGQELCNKAAQSLTSDLTFSNVQCLLYFASLLFLLKTKQNKAKSVSHSQWCDNYRPACSVCLLHNSCGVQIQTHDKSFRLTQGQSMYHMQAGGQLETVIFAVLVVNSKTVVCQTFLNSFQCSA